MAKNAKKPIVAHGKPITSFFTTRSRASQAPSSQDTPSSPPDAQGLHTLSQSQGVALEPAVQLTTKSKNAKTSSKMNDSVMAVKRSPPRRSERKITSRGSSLQPPATSTTLKRGRTPDTQAVKQAATLARPKTPERRKTKFDSDSDVGPSKAVVYVKSPNPQKKKKARLSSPAESARSSNTGLVPSSQSDEEELPSAEPQPRISTVLSAGAKTQSILPTPRPEDDESFAMAVDDDRAGFLTAHPLSDPFEAAQSPKSSQSFGQMLTPPSSDRPLAPSTPVALDQASKTAKIIADIKARAYAKSFSSPEPSLEFKDELSSSDDEDLPVLALPVKKAQSSKMDVEDDEPGPSKRSTRYSLRNTRAASPMEISRPSAPAAQTRPAKKASSSNPFASLLKEKRLAEKRGNSDDILSRADQIALQYGKDSLQDEMDDEEDDDDPSDWTPNTSSASVIGFLKTRPVRRDHSDQDFTIREEDRERILGEEGGKTILDILEQDKVAKRNEGTSTRVAGLPLWTTSPEPDALAMAVDEHYHIPGTSAAVLLLNASLQRGDITRTVSLLNMNLMISIKPEERSAVASSLCIIALSSQSAELAEAATNTLEKFWSTSLEPRCSAISVADLLACMKNLGADPSILTAHNLPYDGPSVPGNTIDRYSAIRRLLVLVISCGRSRRLQSDQVSDLVAGLLLIGMDLRISPELMRDDVQTIDVTIRCLAPDDSVSTQKEFSLACRALAFAASYSPINKLRLLSLLSNGAGRTRRIANFVAYCIITDKATPIVELYTELPPLVDILEQLLPYSRSSGVPPGKFALYDKTDYIDLGFYVAILGVAVSNLKGYVSQERQKARQRTPVAPESPSKMGEKPKTDLQLLHSSLETLHSGISDTRAAHLDRSRTKAAVKQLAMNVHYQREAWIRNNRDDKLRVDQYFAKKV